MVHQVERLGDELKMYLLVDLNLAGDTEVDVRVPGPGWLLR